MKKNKKKNIIGTVVHVGRSITNVERIGIPSTIVHHSCKTGNILQFILHDMYNVNFYRSIIIMFSKADQNETSK